MTTTATSPAPEAHTGPTVRWAIIGLLSVGMITPGEDREQEAPMMAVLVTLVIGVLCYLFLIKEEYAPKISEA